MKKNYLKPTITYVCVECKSIIASSPNSNIGIDKSCCGNDQLSY